MAIQLSLLGTDREADSSAAPEARHGDDQLLDSYSRTISAVVNRVAPKVVNIRVISGARGQGGGSDLPPRILLAFFAAKPLLVQFARMRNERLVTKPRRPEVDTTGGGMSAARNRATIF